MKDILIFVTLLTTILTLSFFTKVNLNAKSGALCLDGSPGAFYKYQPDNPQTAPNKLLIMFEYPPTGTGWCSTQDLSTSVDACAKWQNTEYGSSKNWSSTQTTFRGILAPGVPGQYRFWYKIWIKTCDGGSFLGNTAINLRKSKMYFAGSKIVEETINVLNKNNWLKDRDEVVLAGTFGAGIAAAQWAQVFQKNTNGKVKVLSDAAYYLSDVNHKTNKTVWDNRIKNLEKLVLTNVTFPHQACASKYPNQLWRCFFMDELVRLTPMPFMFTQSLYDSQHIQEILGIQCAKRFGSLSECPKAQKDLISAYHLKVKAALKDVSSVRKQNGVFAISCVGHSMLESRYNDATYQVPMGSGQGSFNAVSDWVTGKKVEWFDQVQWPENSACAHQKVFGLLRENQIVQAQQK